MRPFAPLILLCAACGGPDFASPSGGGDSVPPPVTVSGVVYDSVTGAVAPGLSVALGGTFATTGVDGAFTLEAPVGVDTLHVAGAGFERFSRVLTLLPSQGSPLTVRVPLRRLAPYPISCAIGDSGFRAVIVDLQGRKSLDRWANSTLTLDRPLGSRSIAALDWNYQALDYMQWAVSIPDASLSTFRADWVLFDSEGNAYRGSCEPSATLPDTSQG